MPHLTHWRYIAKENIVRKGEIPCYKQFLLFSPCFLYPIWNLLFILNLVCNSFTLDQSKILSSGNELANISATPHIFIDSYSLAFTSTRLGL